jgi:peptidoglycan hydrolase-like protein with peptidoglycan-binding domain
MADEMVKRAQRFVNSYNVTGIPKLDEDGITGWATMRALTRVLQYELGISALSDSFGPTTLATLQSRFPVIDTSSRIAAINRVIQSALWCKGYDGSQIDGSYDATTAASVLQVKQNMGVAAAYPNGVTPKVFKALLTMDPYLVVNGGSAQIRSIQQWLNGRYVQRRDFFIVPCDGLYSRDVHKAFLLAVQFELGMSDDMANGVFGPATKEGLRTKVLSTGSTGVWVQLFSAAMLVNRRSGVSFTTSFDSDLANRTGDFQSFVRLPVTRQGDFQTWASLLVSTGDNTRRGTAADCATTVTLPRAQALLAAGYTVVGRYLCNTAGSTLDKMIHAGELAILQAAGLRAFPIYQTSGASADYFSHQQGMGDALSAVEWARYHGFRSGTHIYFAVDFDALDGQVTSNVLPHFRGVAATMAEYGREYAIGIYGPRNVCSRVAAEGLTSASFVSDMSTGFSGNLGYPLPENWAFDQISTVTVGSGTGSIQIDNNISSGRDPGQSLFDPTGSTAELDVAFDQAMREAMLTDLRTYLTSVGLPETGGDGGWAGTVRSTLEAFDIAMSWDGLVTRLARTLRVRKALIMSPLLWETRLFNLTDIVADDLVVDHYDGGILNPPSTDSSTGLGQIFAATAIRARNYCIQAGITGGATMDPASEADLWPIWQKLHFDPSYNVGTVPLVLLHAANMIGLPRPTLTTNETDARRVIARYNGTGPEAEEFGDLVLGVYRVLEKYYAPQRA